MITTSPSTKCTDLELVEKRRRAALTGSFVIVVAVFLTFFCVTGHDFVRWDDDRDLYRNPIFLNVSGGSFKQAWAPKHVTMVYQPLDYTIMAAVAIFAKLDAPDRSISEAGGLLNPHYFHWLSLLFHTGNCLLVYVLLLTLFPRKYFACTAATLLFGLHPLQVESVAWASGPDRVINAMFGLLALLAYIYAAKDAHTFRRRAFYILAIVLGVAAYLAKPVAITLPVAALLIDRLILKRDWKTAIRWFAPWQAVLLPLLYVSCRVTPGQDVIKTALWTRPFIAGDALTWYLYKLILPLNLGIEYGRNPHYVLGHWWGYVTWIPVAALVAAAFIIRRKQPLYVAAFCLWLVGLLPDIGLVQFPFEGYSTVADRYNYFALIGPALAAALWLSETRIRYAPAATGAILVILSGLSMVQAATWQDTPTVMAQAISANSTCVIARANLAYYYRDHGRLDRAIQLLNEVIALHPEFSAQLHSDLGIIYLQARRLPEAEAQFRIGVAAHPNVALPYYYLGKTLYFEHRFDEAIVQYQAGYKIDPTPSNLRFGLALALASVGRTQEALAGIDSLLVTDPNFEPAINLRAAIIAGRFDANKNDNTR